MNRQQRRRQERELKKMEKQVDGELETRPGVNVMVLVPCQSEVKAAFAYDLAQMMSFTASHFVKPGIIDTLGVGFQIGTYVHTARQALVMGAMQKPTDYFLFIDSDMRFPPDALVKLLTHQEAMVGVNYPSRAPPIRWLGVKTVADKEAEVGGKGVLLETQPESTGLEEVDAMGFGFVLIRRDVFEALPDPRENGPWWWYEWMPKRKAQIGEDVYFCRLVAEHGVTLFIDHDLSKRIQHIGTEVFGPDHVWAADAMRAEAKAKAELDDGSDHELLDAGSGDRGRSEQDGPDGDDSGVHPEGRSEDQEGRPGEAAGGPDPAIGLSGSD